MLNLPKFLFVLIAISASNLVLAQSAPMPKFDFSKGRGVAQWTATHDVASLKPTPEGMQVSISGTDPYIHGPLHNLPEGKHLWLRVRLKSETGGTGQFFYFEKNPTEERSIRFAVRKGVWDEIRLPLPPLGKNYHLRFDPPGDSGECVLAMVAYEERILFAEPDWVAPVLPNPLNERLSVTSGNLKLVAASAQWNDYLVKVDDTVMAAGHTRPLIGIFEEGQQRWLDLSERVEQGDMKRENNAIVSTLTLSEGNGRLWKIQQRIQPSQVLGAIDVELKMSVNRDTKVLHLPLLTLLPGFKTYETAKTQALFPGLEYLDKNELSSSEADIIGPGSKRQTPDVVKVTIPLMSLQHEDRYIGLVWKPDPAFCPLFDSPDRRLRSNAHVMGILYPGSDGNNREEGNLLPYDAALLKANQPLTLQATIIGGRGLSVIPSVEKYVALRGLPATPNAPSLQDYLNLTTAGWLDSGIIKGDEYRHALPGSFAFHPVADVPLMMEWMATKTTKQDAQSRLRSAAKQALARVPASNYHFTTIGHIRYFATPLVFGNVIANARNVRENAQGSLRRFEPDGSIVFKKSPDGLDYGRTHFAPDANGLTGQVVASLLEAASITGDANLIREGLQKLRALNKFDNTVPRGAQTWEVPLHTPDILASAHLVRAYTLGYAMTGDTAFLERARYWAWTGVPLVYLIPPQTARAAEKSGTLGSTEPIGTYATIAVLGATQWIAPNWMGLPVQWCGLVYADALYRLGKYDPNPIWKQLADGITVSGIQQTWQLGQNELRQGLLPDSFTPRTQTRNDAAINPGTVLACATWYYTNTPLADFHAFRGNGLVMAHAPGTIRNTSEASGKITFNVAPWTKSSYEVFVVGLKKAPNISLNGRAVALSEKYQYLPDAGWLILRVEGNARIELTL